MYLYEDKIILTFNYKDGAKTITLAEVEGSDLSVLARISGNHPMGGCFFCCLNAKAKLLSVNALKFIDAVTALIVGQVVPMDEKVIALF